MGAAGRRRGGLFLQFLGALGFACFGIAELGLGLGLFSILAGADAFGQIRCRLWTSGSLGRSGLRGRRMQIFLNLLASGRLINATEKRS